MTDPCGGPLNLLKDQYQRWWTSVFLTITSECANIPAFSYLRAQVFIVSSLRKAARLSRGTISCSPPDWKKASLINGLVSPPKGFPFFASRWAPGEGRSCGPTSWSRDRQFFRSGPDRATAVRKTIGLTAEFRLPQESAGVDGPLDCPVSLGSACLVTGNSGPFAGDQFSGDIRLSDTLRPIRMDQRIRRKAGRAI